MCGIFGFNAFVYVSNKFSHALIATIESTLHQLPCECVPVECTCDQPSSICCHQRFPDSAATPHHLLPPTGPRFSIRSYIECYHQRLCDIAHAFPPSGAIRIFLLYEVFVNHFVLQCFWVQHPFFNNLLH